MLLIINVIRFERIKTGTPKSVTLTYIAYPEL